MVEDNINDRSEGLTVELHLNLGHDFTLWCQSLSEASVGEPFPHKPYFCWRCSTAWSPRQFIERVYYYPHTCCSPEPACCGERVSNRSVCKTCEGKKQSEATRTSGRVTQQEKWSSKKSCRRRRKKRSNKRVMALKPVLTFLWISNSTVYIYIYIYCISIYVSTYIDIFIYTIY